MPLPEYVRRYQTRKWKTVVMEVASGRYQSLKALLDSASGFEQCSSDSLRAQNLGDHPQRFYFDEEQVAADLNIFGVFGVKLDRLSQPFEEFPAGTLVISMYTGYNQSSMTVTVCFEVKEPFDWVKEYKPWAWKRHDVCTPQSLVWQELRSNGPLCAGGSLVQICHSCEQRPVPIFGRRLFCTDVELRSVGFIGYIDPSSELSMVLEYRFENPGGERETPTHLMSKTLIMRVYTKADEGRGKFILFTASLP